MDKRGLITSLKFLKLIGIICFWVGIILIIYLHGWRTAIAIYLIVFGQNTINGAKGLIK